MVKQIHPRCNGDTCILCRRKFEAGDRVQVVHIVEKIGANPMSPRDVGAWLSSEFELKHVICADTGLEGALIGGMP